MWEDNDLTSKPIKHAAKTNGALKAFALPIKHNLRAVVMPEMDVIKNASCLPLAAGPDERT